MTCLMGYSLEYELNTALISTHVIDGLCTLWKPLALAGRSWVVSKSPFLQHYHAIS